jgi:DNA-binding MarR family transcriptional regulator
MQIVKDSPINDPDMVLWILFDRTRYALARTREIELGQFDLSGAQAMILHILLSNNRGMTIQEIANYNVRKPNAILTLINRMEKLGLVEKKQNGEDDKAYIHITRKGSDLYQGAARRSIQMSLSVLTEEERELFASILTRINNKTREMLGVDFIPPFIKKADEE